MPVLYLIQNDTHLKNFRSDITEVDYYIDIGRFTGQQLKFCGDFFGTEVVVCGGSVNFYRMNVFQRIYFLINFWRKNTVLLKSIVVDKVVIGNDGAIQRLIIECLADSKVPVDMWLDGLIDLSSSYWANFRKILFGRLLEVFRCSHFVPSVIGTYSRIQTLYVMDQYVKDEYERFGALVGKVLIRVVQFPRHKLLVDMANDSCLRSRKGRPVRPRVLYLTSAWLFHGYRAEHKAQIEHIRSLVGLFGSTDEFEFFVRVHPRESQSDYSFMPRQYYSDFDSYEDDLCSADIVLSARSTGLFEAAKIGRISLIYNPGFGDRHLNGFCRGLKMIHSADEVLAVLRDTISA